ncbi:MAG: hypothetical protein KBS74_05070 [Clostridiales bacterium]|nr:hypothetical protein [Candidatus Cacconaster stercorequi]
MKKTPLNYRFHNPNSAAASADYILKVLLEANAKKVESAIQKDANAVRNVEKKSEDGHSA